MTLPQDSRAPMRQQRWIELENVGGVPIPSFGVCEIVNSYRPEQATSYTPNDGRTVLRVQMPSKENLCGSVVNGPCEIPVGESRRVGTMDDPMLAQVASAYYTPGMSVGVKAGSFMLHEGGCGYVIIGDYDPGTNTMRVMRWDACQTEMYVEAYECIYPGDDGKIAFPMKWNATQRCWEKNDAALPVKICDCAKWLLAIPGDCFKVERMNSCDTTSTNYGETCYRPAFPYGLTRRVRIKEPISPNGCGDATILKPSEAEPCVMEETECVIRVCNGSKRHVGCDADEDATLHIAPGECGTDKPICYGWIDVGPRPVLAKCVTGQVCGTDTTIQGIEYMDVSDWTPREEPTLARNPMRLYNCAGDWVILGWNDSACMWEIIQVTHHFIDPVLLGIQCKDGSCGVDQIKTVAGINVQQCDSCGETTRDTVIEGKEITVATDIDFSCSAGCSPSIKFAKLCILCGDTEPEETERSLPTVSVDVVTEVGPYSVDEDEDGIPESCGLTAFKKSVCLLGCDNGTGAPDTIAFTKVEALTDAVFACDPCPELTPATTGVWVLCADSSETTWETVACECVDCAAASASSTPSATGA